MTTASPVNGCPLMLCWNRSHDVGLHPVAKPVKLLQFLVETYTRPGAVVLDNAMGAGSTGIACALTGRRLVGIEKEPTFFYIAEHVIRASTGNPPNLVWVEKDRPFATGGYVRPLH